MERSSSRQSSRALSRTNSVRSAPSQIKVVVRFRPGQTSAPPEDPGCIEELSEDTVRIKGLNQSFVFDKVFPPSATQTDIFTEAVKPTVEGVLKGYNGCVLAYGQTGAGKSHTMMGPSVSSEMRGVIPRMVEYLFTNKPKDHQVKVGYMEIYNEKVRDLLGEGTDLKVHENAGGGGFHVKGLMEIIVDSAAEVYAIMQRGDKQRSTAATNMNAYSSRSHSVFLVDVCGAQTRSKLVLVDLAGSEKVAKTGARGSVLEEAANINRSLSSLGMVVNALASQSTAESDATSGDAALHIPFRDSKLTRILQDSLAGNSRTCLIVHCSPLDAHISETVSTLRFGLRAKNVKTVPRINFVQQQLQQHQYQQQHQLLLVQHQALQQQHNELLEQLAQRGIPYGDARSNGGAQGDLQAGLRSNIQCEAQTNLQPSGHINGQTSLQPDPYLDTISGTILPSKQVSLETPLESLKELNAGLVTENHRLLSQIQYDTRRLAQTQKYVSMLQSQIQAIENQQQNDEHYLFNEVAALEPRIHNLLKK